MKKFIQNGCNFPLILILYLFISFNSTLSYEYCNKNYTGRLCQEGNIHMTCSGTIEQRYFQNKVHMPTTIQGYVYPSNRLFRKLFLDYHNIMRDIFASGVTVSTLNNLGFPPQSRTRVFQWDYEMEYLAEWNAFESMAMIHDHCHNMDRFTQSGQNIASYSAFPFLPIDLYGSINETLWEMFDEKDIVTDAPELPYAMKTVYLEAGHFTQIINDRQAFFGCALSMHFNCCLCEPIDRRTPGPIEYVKVFWACYYWTCNYEANNRIGVPLYIPSNGEPANNCTTFWETGKSKEYPNLCENSGRIFRHFPVGGLLEYDIRFVPPEEFKHTDWY